VTQTTTALQLAELIRTRRTIGAFTSQPIPEGLIESLLDTAVWTPNHRLTEPWRFIYLTGAGRDGYATVRSEMAISEPTSPEQVAAKAAVFQKFSSMPAILMVVMKISTNAEIAEEDYGACCALIQNFLLLAWEQGLGTAWKTFKNHALLRTYLKLEADEKVAGVIHLGYPDEAPVSQRKPVHQRITYLR
jgi:nitroreductase